MSKLKIYELAGAETITNNSPLIYRQAKELAAQLAELNADYAAERERADKAEATIARVEPLVEKWNKAPTDYRYELAFKEGMEYCTNELKQALRNDSGN